MSAVETTSHLTVTASQELSARLHDTPAVAELRAKAAEAMDVLGMPLTIERPWKYHDVSSLDASGYRPGLPAGEAEAPVLAGEYAAVVRQVNCETESVEVRAEGLHVEAFDRAEAKLRAVIDRHLGTAAVMDRNRLTALHYAFLAGGLIVEVEPNVELKLPVRIARNYVDGAQLATPHTLIVTGANSRVMVIEDYRSSDEDILALPAIEIIAGPGAQVNYTQLHRWGSNTRVYSEQRAIPERDAAVVGLALVTGGKVVKGHIESSLAGRGSSSELFGLFMGSDSQHIDFYTLQDHIGPDTRSDLLFKSALKGDARSVYYGMTRVGLGARNADANQENRNLLLSKTARADSDPVLEILTSQVIRASHGATAGPVDQEQLFYLESRGLTPLAAEALLVRGFLAQVLDRVPDEALRAELADALEEKLAQG